MALTPIGEELFPGAQWGLFCGAETAISFGDARAEFAALRHGAAVFDLGWQVCFRISGADRVRWLNNMVSNNIRELPPGEGNYNFLLTSQGHILGDLFVYNRGEDFVACTDKVQLGPILATLRKYIIMDKVELADLGRERTILGIQGPESEKILKKAGFCMPFASGQQAMPELKRTEWRGMPLGLVRKPLPAPASSRAGAQKPVSRYELWELPAKVSEVWDALVAAGATPAGARAVDMFRVLAGIPRYGVDISERELPQETAQMQALNFTKGCYIGQEIVERIRARGSVHRTFTGFRVHGPAPLPGAKIQSGGSDVGEITSVEEIPFESGARVVLALGYVRRPASAPGTTVSIEGAPATVSQLPFALD